MISKWWNQFVCWFDGHNLVPIKFSNDGKIGTYRCKRCGKEITVDENELS